MPGHLRLTPAPAVAAALLVALALGPPTLAGEHELEEHETEYVYGYPDDPSTAWINAIGGRLYDNWIEALDAEEPEETHPAWPASNTKHEGESTWRCKSCHGWDFLGAEGKYASGSYQTGIKGVSGVAGAEPAAIREIILNDTHRFTEEMIPGNYLDWLATFLSRGQYDIRQYVSDAGEVSGDTEHGRAIFQNICAACHGYDGTALDWGDDKPAYVGTEANANPWEVFFKIRHGHPGYEMVSLAAFDLQDAADVLAYVKTLPQE